VIVLRGKRYARGREGFHHMLRKRQAMPEKKPVSPDRNRGFNVNDARKKGRIIP